ncbi:MAG: PAS domain-containing protein [Candidatus Erginobacter occultus]|nr:PAS domain-containing protein [Candidatus Erginobacter occultus]
MKQRKEQDRDLSPGTRRGAGPRLERDRLRQILDSMEDLVYITGADHRVEYVNPPMRKIFGPVRGRRCFDYLHHHQTICSWCRKSEILGGKVVHWEWSSARTGRTYDVIESPLANPDGTVSKLKLMRDITERKQLASRLEKFNEQLEEIVISRTRELSSANELLERLFSSVHFLLAYLDADFNFRRVNRAYAEAYRQEPEYFVGKNHFRLFPHPEHERIFRKVVRTGRPFVVFSRPFVYPDHPKWGTTYWDWSLRPVLDSEGEVEGLILILVDVPERKRAQGKLIRAEKKMAELERLAELGTLSSMVAHEMRNPLATIALAAANLRRKTSDPALLKHIRSIEGKVKSGERVIGSLLGYSRVQLPRYRNIFILPFLRSCISDSLKSHRDIRPEVALDLAALKRKKISVDPDQLREVFVNILDNALEAVPAEGGRIEAAGGFTKDGAALFRFRDNGPPISPADRKEIFTPFFTRKPSGNGLGLAICRQLVRLHNGTIKLTSGPKRGTEVTVRIPPLPRQ